MKKKQKIRNLKQSHSAKKLEREDPLGLLKLQFAAKYRKNGKGTLCRQKNLTMPKQIQRGSLQSRPVLYLKLKRG